MVISKVIVVGGGPSGLVLALLLGNAGIKVEILEAANQLDESPRATFYSYPALYELKRAGLLDEIRERGYIPPGSISWRKVDKTLLARTNGDAIPLDYQLHCLPLGELCKLVEEHLSRNPNVEIRYLHKVVELDQSEGHARVTVDAPDGRKTLEADYIVGCDGANSQIRRSLFGDHEFPGRTWDEQIVATNVFYDVEKYGLGVGYFIVDPEHWSMVVKIKETGLYRVTYGEVSGLTREEYLARQPDKFRKILPGNPSPDDYKLVTISPYKIHQRCVKTLRVGRFLLAADAAHLCNPFGGLGLTGGFVDVGNLFDCLYGIHKGLADDSILDRYSEVRREKYYNYIDPMSSANITRLINDPDKAVKEDPFFHMCQEKENDPEAWAQMVKGLDVIMHDFTKEYRQPASSPPSSDKPLEGT